jgi:hypothetical protein
VLLLLTAQEIKNSGAVFKHTAAAVIFPEKSKSN